MPALRRFIRDAGIFIKICFDNRFRIDRREYTMMKSTKEENIALIRQLSEAKAPSGFEDEAIAVGREFAQSFADVEEDCLRNLYVTRR